MPPTADATTGFSFHSASVTVSPKHFFHDIAGEVFILVAQRIEGRRYQKLPERECPCKRRSRKNRRIIPDNLPPQRVKDPFLRVRYVYMTPPYPLITPLNLLIHEGDRLRVVNKNYS